jgi:hypothetical protein
MRAVNNILSKAGSFWGQHMRREDFQALSQIADTATAAHIIRRLEELTDAAVGRDTVKYYIPLRVNKSPSSQELQKFTKVAEFRGRLGDTAEMENGFETPDGDLWYAVTFDQNIKPLLLRINDSMLVSGIDFVGSYGRLLIRAAACVNGLPDLITGVAVAARAKSTTEFMTGLSGRNDSVVDFLRKGQSILALERAAAQYAGLFVFSDEDEVVDVFAFGGDTIYTTLKHGQVRIQYTHSRLETGSHVNKGHIIRGRFSIEQARSAEHIVEFFSAFENVNLDLVLPHPGLVWDPRRTVDCVSDSATAGKPHAKLMLSGDEGSLSAWHASQRRAEIAQPSYTLADYVGMTTVGQAIQVDFSEVLWQRYGNMLLLVANADSDRQEKLDEFLREHRPTTAFILKNNTPPP